MKRTLTILSAALFAGALSVPAVQAQEPAAPAAGATAAAPAAEAPAPAAEASPTTKKHHMRHHHHKKSSMKGESGSTGATWRDRWRYRYGSGTVDSSGWQQLAAAA